MAMKPVRSRVFLSTARTVQFHSYFLRPTSVSLLLLPGTEFSIGPDYRIGVSDRAYVGNCCTKTVVPWTHKVTRRTRVRELSGYAAAVPWFRFLFHVSRSADRRTDALFGAELENGAARRAAFVSAPSW
ncbi:hypothetical protein E4U52_005388 [Claviceps spartinae]|nr:hypothetical protein E4U52_005388 [Claviceps spartinae]